MGAGCLRTERHGAVSGGHAPGSAGGAGYHGLEVIRRGMAQ